MANVKRAMSTIPMIECTFSQIQVIFFSVLSSRNAIEPFQKKIWQTEVFNTFSCSYHVLWLASVVCNNKTLAKDKYKQNRTVCLKACSCRSFEHYGCHPYCMEFSLILSTNCVHHAHFNSLKWLFVRIQ